MAEMEGLFSHLGLAFITIYILSQRVPLWNSYAYMIYFIYAVAGVLTHILKNNNNVIKIYRLLHDIAYVACPALIAVGVALGIYRMNEPLAYIFLIVPLLYAIDFFVKIDHQLIEILTQVVCIAILIICVLGENTEGCIAGGLLLVASVMNHIHSAATKDTFVVNLLLIGACIALWYAFGGHF